jgi:alanine racemase
MIPAALTTPFSPETMRAWVDVDLAALVANARTVATVSGSRLLPMIKANGYGLGAVEVARALERVEPWGFGVASIEEGRDLRAAGMTRPILVATPLIPAWVERYLELDLRPAIGDLVALEAWTSRSDRPFHLEIDSGMSRGGVRWDDRSALESVRRTLAAAPGWEGAFTHFLDAEANAAMTALQWQRFQQVLESFAARPALVHAANSAAALQGSLYAADLVRPGIFLYGGTAGTAVPRPVASLRARVVAVRSVQAGDTVGYEGAWRAPEPSVIATLSVGYADGFPRSSRSTQPGPREIELNGKVVPLVARVTMDMCMVQVEGPVAVGDVGTVYGGLVSIERQAESAGTISYELLTRIGARVPRRYRT